MPKATPYEEDGKTTGYMVFCPACKCGHLFNIAPGTNGAGGRKPCWTFDGNVDSPTFSPSMLVQSVDLPPRDPATGDFKRGPDGKTLLDTHGRILGTKDTVCHSFVRGGKIQFLGDCTHALKNQTVDLPDMGGS